jgi:hypothetical protein
VPRAARASWQEAFRSAAALVLRSLVAAECSNLSTAVPHSCEGRDTISHTYARFAVLCALTADVAGPLAPNDALLNAAAARCTYLLLDPPCPSECTPFGQAARMRRLLAATKLLRDTVFVFRSGANALTAVSMAGDTMECKYPHQLGGAAAAVHSASEAPAASVAASERLCANLLKAARLLLIADMQQGQDANAPVSESERELHQNLVVKRWLMLLLASPATLSCHALLRAQLAATQPLSTSLVALLQGLCVDNTIPSHQALSALSALCMVIAGSSKQHKLASGHKLDLLPPSACLADPELRRAYLEALLVVLRRTAHPAIVRQLNSQSRRVVKVQLWPLCQSAHLAALLAGRSEHMRACVGASDVETGLDALIGAYAALVKVRSCSHCALLNVPASASVCSASVLPQLCLATAVPGCQDVSYAGECLRHYRDPRCRADCGAH